MMNYKDWETLNESIGTGYTLGLVNPASLGLVGDNFQEARPPFIHDDDDEDEEDGDDYDGDITDDDEDDGLEGDIMGGEEEDGIMGSEEGPESSFPPDGDMDDAEEDDDGMGGILGDIDPELAGLEDDKIGPDGEMTGMGDELGPELTGGEMGDEMGDMDMGDLGDEMGDMGDEMGMMMPCPECNPDGDMEEGDPACEICGGEGEVADEEGGDLDVDMAGDMEGDMGMDMEEDPEGEVIAVSDLMHRMQDYMSRYMAPKMSAHMDAGGGGGGAEYMAADNNQAAKYSKQAMAGRSTPSTPPHAKSKSFMNKSERRAQGEKKAYGDASFEREQEARNARKGGGQPHGQAQSAGRFVHGGELHDFEDHMKKMKHMDKMKYMDKEHKHEKNMKKMSYMKHMKNMDKSHMKNMKRMKQENFVGSDRETHDDFLANLMQSALDGLPKKGKSGLSEDALFQVVSPEEMAAPDPQVGGVGFAPQGRVGEIGGGYTQDDISDIPVLGEGKKGRYITLDQYIAKKAS